MSEDLQDKLLGQVQAFANLRRHWSFAMWAYWGCAGGGAVLCVVLATFSIIGVEDPDSPLADLLRRVGLLFAGSVTSASFGFGFVPMLRIRKLRYHDRVTRELLKTPLGNPSGAEMDRIAERNEAIIIKCW